MWATLPGKARARYRAMSSAMAGNKAVAGLANGDWLRELHLWTPKQRPEKLAFSWADAQGTTRTKGPCASKAQF